MIRSALKDVRANPVRRGLFGSGRYRPLPIADEWNHTEHLDAPDRIECRSKYDYRRAPEQDLPSDESIAARFAVDHQPDSESDC